MSLYKGRGNLPRMSGNSGIRPPNVDIVGISQDLLSCYVIVVLKIKWSKVLLELSISTLLHRMISFATCGLSCGRMWRWIRKNKDWSSGNISTPLIGSWRRRGHDANPNRARSRNQVTLISPFSYLESSPLAWLYLNSSSTHGYQVMFKFIKALKSDCVVL